MHLPNQIPVQVHQVIQEAGGASTSVEKQYSYPITYRLGSPEGVTAKL